jgi:DNA-binding XRE family transcriptional regulator
MSDVLSIVRPYPANCQWCVSHTYRPARPKNQKNNQKFTLHKCDGGYTVSPMARIVAVRDIAQTRTLTLTLTLTLPERMLIVRRRLGLSQVALGKLMRLSRFTINRIERGRVGYSVRKAELARVRERWALVEHRYRERILEGNGQ